MEEPTEKQIKFAKNLGIEDPESFSKKALSEMIDRKTKKKEGYEPKVTDYPETTTEIAQGNKLSPSQKVSITSKCFTTALDMLDNTKGIEKHEFYGLVENVLEEYMKIYHSI